MTAPGFAPPAIDAIDNGLSRGKFIGRFTKSGAKDVGTFYAGGNQPTADLLIPYLEAAFGVLKEGLPAQWQLRGAEGGFVFLNNGVEAFLRILSDIVDNVIADEGVSPLTASTEELIEASRQFLDPLVDHLEGLSLEEGAAYRKIYGSGAGLQYYRKLQQALCAARPSFDAQGLDDWVKAQDKQFTNEAREIGGDLEAFFKKDIRERLEDEYGADWERNGISRTVRKASGERANEKNLDLDPSEHVSAWDIMYIADYHDVLVYSQPVWQSRFAARYTRPKTRISPVVGSTVPDGSSSSSRSGTTSRTDAPSVRRTTRSSSTCGSGSSTERQNRCRALPGASRRVPCEACGPVVGRSGRRTPREDVAGRDRPVGGLSVRA
jgi:DNA sulfur modification protein DndB